MSLINQICESNLRSINIVGVPGAGKTTLVTNISSRESARLFLYLSFGRENTKSASSRMGNNVTCSSFHSYAKRAMDIDNSRIVKSYSMRIASENLKLLGIDLKGAKMLEAFCILNDEFCMSGFPLRQLNSVAIKVKNYLPFLTKQEKNELIIAFGQFWQKLWSAKDRKKLKVTHNMYFKAYAESANRVPFDVVVIDEYQDLNDAMISLIDRFLAVDLNLKVIRLGDPVQQIYSFNGASSQFSKSNFHFRLRESYRFGKSLCELANSFMAAQDIGYYTNILPGNQKVVTSLEYSKDVKVIIELAKAKKFPTIIARNNSTLWHMIKNIAIAGLKCSLAGNDKKELEFLRALFQLKNHEKTNHPALRGKSYFSYVNNAKLNKNSSALLAARFVEKIGDDEALFSKIEKSLTSKSEADVLLTTVHQAKGLEFNHVILANDFTPCVTPDGQFKKVEIEEAHTIYTAITRAKKSLTVPKSWRSLKLDSFR